MEKSVKKILIIMAVACSTVACDSPWEDVAKASEFSIEVKIDTLDYKMAYLSQWKDGGFVTLDSTEIDTGRFSFKGNVESPNVQYIIFDNTDARITLFIENSPISITGSNLELENLKVKGSSIHSKLEKFNEFTDEYDDKLKLIIKDYRAAEELGDENLVDELGDKYNKEDSIKLVFIERYINDNLNSVLGPYLTIRYMMNKEVEELEVLYKSFSDSLSNSEYVQQIDERIVVVKNSAIGQPAPTFSMNDVDGNPIALESFKGNYVFIDFWASWCGPCRAENPNVVVAYNKYHDKGLEILGVSFDKDKEKWLEAIAKDELAWQHVSDLKGWNNAVGKIYGVRSIPQSVLIDKEGIIIAKNLKKEELHEKLAEIFNENK